MIEVVEEKENLLSVKKSKEISIKTKTPRQLILKKIKPLTINQNKTFQSYNKDKNLLLHGVAGSGKSFISMYLALDEIMDQVDISPFKSIIIIRSTVPVRDLGFLPGSAAEKSMEYEAPYQAIAAELFEQQDAYKQLKARELVEFRTTSFIRGITLNDCIVIVDEIQNMDIDELRSIITRTGDNTKLIFCGDFRQSDFRGRDKEYKKDVTEFINIIRYMKDDFDLIEFDINDIVRSKLVKNFLIAEEAYLNL
jgi:phosphate starvation-inducible PhoH-like protein/PhoH-like ATPase